MNMITVIFPYIFKNKIYTLKRKKKKKMRQRLRLIEKRVNLLNPVAFNLISFKTIYLFGRIVDDRLNRHQSIGNHRLRS